MEYLISSIASFVAFISIYYFNKEHKTSKKFAWISFSFLFIFTIAVAVYMYKCYEVPIHNNRISYMFSTNSKVRSITGHSTINFIYDYNTFKEVKKTDYFGKIIEDYPRVVIETYIKCYNDTGNVMYIWDSPEIVTYQLDANNNKFNERSSKDIFGDWKAEAFEMLNRDSAYFSYLKKDGVPVMKPAKVVGQDIAGSLFMVEFAGSNRQNFYAFRKSTNRDHSEFVEAGTKIGTSFALYDENNDTIILNHEWNYFIKKASTVNSQRFREYAFIPSSDSIIATSYYVALHDFKKPSIFWTAEDISQAVEMLWIDLIKSEDFNMCIKSLSFDYLGPSEFSSIYPEPDCIEMSKLSYTDSLKIDYIEKNGLKFHVKFPDMENLQQIRMWFVTILLSGLIALLFQRIGHMYSGQLSEKVAVYIKNHKNLFIILTALLFILAISFLTLIVIQSHVDAFDLYGNRTFGVF